MQTPTEIPFLVDAAALIEQAHLEHGSVDAQELLLLVELAMKVGRPKAVYAESFVASRDGDIVVVDGISFTSRTLSRNLASSERVFPLVTTCGHEMDEASPAGGDMLKEFWWELIKASLLGAANKYLDDHLQRAFRLGKTAILRPGSGDPPAWPIDQQQGLFALLGDVEQAIGVRLTDSFIMVPNKTTSGMLFPAQAGA